MTTVQSWLFMRPLMIFLIACPFGLAVSLIGALVRRYRRYQPGAGVAIDGVMPAPKG